MATKNGYVLAVAGGAGGGKRTNGVGRRHPPPMTKPRSPRRLGSRCRQLPKPMQNTKAKKMATMGVCADPGGDGAAEDGAAGAKKVRAVKSGTPPPTASKS
jgi:hypothetical protein